MNDLVVCPRIVAGTFFLSITSLRACSAWLLTKSGDMLPAVIGHNEPITECTLASVPAHAAVVIETADALTITISRDLPFYVVAGRKHAIAVGFSHQASFKAEESQGNRNVTHFALPCVELCEYVLDLVMRPGQTVQISGQGFEQVVKVQ